MSGHVRLADGSDAAGLTLRFISTAPNQSEIAVQTAITNNRGQFGLLLVPAGTYRVEMSGTDGSKAGVLATVVIEENQSTRLDLQAVPASTVTPQSASGAAVVESDRVLHDELSRLPIEDLEWESVSRAFSSANDATVIAESAATERDGAADTVETARRGGGQAGETSAASGATFAGLPVTQNVETVDGFSNQQMFRSGPRGAAANGSVSGSSSYAQGSVRSLRIAPRSFSAELGNAPGGSLIVSTRAPADAFHGGALYLLRDSAFAATNPYATVTHYANGVITSSYVKPRDDTNQFGGHITFPLWHSGERATGLFASVDEQLRSNPVISTPSSPSFYALSFAQKRLLQVRGVTLAAQNTALNYLDSLTGPIARSTNRTLAFVRLDSQIGSRDRLSATYALNDYSSPAGSDFDQNSEAVTSRGRGSVGDRTIDANAAGVSWRHSLSTHTTNELRFQWARDLETELPRAPLPQEPAVSVGGLAPQVSIEPDGFTYGTPSGLGRSAYPDEQRVQGGERLVYVLGRHLVTLGGEWSRVHERIAQLANREGTFLYDSGVATTQEGGLLNWITDYTFDVNAYPNAGCPSIFSAVHVFCFRSFTQSFGGEDTSFTTHDFAGFAQDTFRVRPGLTMSLGVRYEYLLLPLPQLQNTALDAAFATAGGSLGGATSSFPEDRNNFGPRAALAWTPAHGTFGTIRLGYGTFFGRLTGATTHAALTETALPSSMRQIRITPSTEVACPQTGGQFFGFPCTFLSAPPAAVAQTSSALLFAKGFRLPAVQRASLSLERSVGHHAMVRAEYTASIATQLPGSTDLNIAPATASRTFVIQGGDGYEGVRSGQTFTVPLYTRRRVAQYGPVTSVVSNANSTYHSGTIEAELRNFRGFELRESFTFSRSIDYGPQLGATPRQNGQFDPFSNGYDKGLSSLSFPVRFSGTLIYRTRVLHATAWKRRILGGWQVSSIAFAGSGAPYSYGVFGGTRLNGGRESINGSGGANYLPTVGRNTLRLPPRASVDLRLGREWKTGRVTVNAFAEAFNILNQRNLSRLETRAFLPGTPASETAPTPLVFQDAATVAAEGLTTRPFGTPTSSTAAFSRERQAELGLRLSF